MADPFLLSAGFYLDPAVLALSASAEVAVIRSLGYCADAETGGLIHAAIVPSFVRNPTRGRIAGVVHELTTPAHDLPYYYSPPLWTIDPRGYRLREERPLWRFAPPPQVWRVRIPNDVRELVYRRDGYRCVVCGSPDDLTLDHVYPWSLGGSDDPGNLQTMCRPHNSAKGARVT